MRRAKVVVSWEDGLHARPASKLVALARTFTSAIHLKCGQQVANARSIVSILLLCASLGTPILVEVDGDDEDKAMEAVENVFRSGG